MSGVKINGKVKWFNNAKGYGFINAEGKPDEDLFAHYSAITMDGYKTLKAGQAVSFETIEGPKGLHAVNIDTVNAVVHEKPATPAAKKKKRKSWPDPPLNQQVAIKNRPSQTIRDGRFFLLPAVYMCEISASPKPEDDTSLAPSIKRSKS